MLLLALTVQPATSQQQVFNRTDVDNFWYAHDRIIATKDSTEQYQLLQDLYINKASKGLKKLMEVRHYAANEYINAINQYPQFWKSIRKNTMTVQSKQATIQSSILKLKKVYPLLKPSPITFAIGAFRTNGTIKDGHVLIGAEMALADSSTDIHELPEALHYFYTRYRPLEELPLLCTHEYVHTQQQLPLDNMLCNTLYEGIAEFVSCLALNEASSTPSFAFAKKNEAVIKRKYVEDLFMMDRMYNWIWGINRNELKERDLGYYIGYRICEEFYRKAKDKKKAIQQMIQLDYRNDTAVEAFVDGSGFFDKPLSKMLEAYESSRPLVTGIEPFENGSSTVKPGKTLITLHFSKPLNRYNTGIDFGPLGEEYCPKISLDKRVWAEDGKSWTFEADLKPKTHYQILISNNFRMQDGTRLKPYLIDISTTE